MAKIETGLTLKGNVELGKKLVDRAVEEHKDQMMKQVVGFVQEILAYIEIQKTEKAKCDENIEGLEEKIKALERGEFKLGRDGIILFDDPELQKATVRGPSSCPNCGFGSGVRPVGYATDQGTLHGDAVSPEEDDRTRSKSV
jgi:hypothetical protein